MWKELQLQELIIRPFCLSIVSNELMWVGPLLQRALEARIRSL